MNSEIDLIKIKIEAMTAAEAFLFWSNLSKDQKKKYKSVVADKVGTLSGFCLK